MSNIWITSDIHFGHKSIIQYENRPFGSVEEMDEIIIQNLNSYIKKNDVVYHVGDFALGKYNNIDNLCDLHDRLKGEWYCIPGDHEPRGLEKVFDVTRQIYKRDIKNKTIIMCHYPMIFWPKSHFNSWMLHGHHHANSKEWVEQFTKGKIFNVCIGAHDYFPYSFDEIKEIMDKKEDNLNLVKKQ